MAGHRLHGSGSIRGAAAARAAAGARADVRSAGERPQVALALALPSPRPGLPADLEQEIRRRITDLLPKRFVAIATFQIGHAGGLIGLHATFRKLSEGSFDACVVAGVESYLSPETLEWLEQNDQLHGAGPLNNAWGFIPGEAAGAALLVSGVAVERLGMELLGQVLSVGRGFEQNKIKTETVCIGEGLTVAFREGLAGLPPGALVTDVYCDMNGEPYRADEFGFTCVRMKESFVSASDFVAPADCWGDVSAASAPLHLMLSTIAGRKAYANGSYPFLGPAPRAANAEPRCFTCRCRSESSRARHDQGQRHVEFAGPQGEQRHLDGDCS